MPAPVWIYESKVTRSENDCEVFSQNSTVMLPFISYDCPGHDTGSTRNFQPSFVDPPLLLLASLLLGESIVQIMFQLDKICQESETNLTLLEGRYI